MLKSFVGPEGQNPGTTLVLSGKMLYGTTYAGGSSSCGTVFKLQTNGTGYTVLQNFTGPTLNGDVPSGDLILSGNWLYGTSEEGGPSGLGTVFKLTTNGTSFTTLRSMQSADEWCPRAGLVLVGNALYGTTYGRPPPPSPYSYGTVFMVTTNASDHFTLKDFTFSSPYDGQDPHAGLVFSRGVLYGTTFWGGVPNRGTIFALSTNGAGYQALKDFSGTDGANPRGTMVLSGSLLFGTTQAGGNSNLGTIFNLNTNGTGFSVLKHFAGSDGSTPLGPLLLSGATLYGTTYDGGVSNAGTIFRIGTDGSSFAVIKHFTGTDGLNPVGGLVMSGGVLYGTTYLGGSSGQGVVFSLNLTPVLTSVRTGSAMTLNWTAIEGLAYQLQYKTALSQANWTNFGSSATATNSLMTASVSVATDLQRFYRVSLVH